MEDCQALTKLLSLSTDIVKFYKTFCDTYLAAMPAACNGDTSLLEVLRLFITMKLRVDYHPVKTLASLEISGNHLPPEAVELIINEFHHSTLQYVAGAV